MDKWQGLAKTQVGELLDLSILRALDDFSTADEPSLAKQILNTYLNITPPVVELIVRASHSADRATMRKQAHSLKSSSGNIGAISFADICDQLERRTANEGSIADLQVAADRLLSEFLLVRKGLETVLQCLD